MALQVFSIAATVWEQYSESHACVLFRPWHTAKLKQRGVQHFQKLEVRRAKADRIYDGKGDNYSENAR